MNAGTILIVGGTSDIGLEIARIFAGNGWAVWLTGRDPSALERNAHDIGARSEHSVQTFNLDIVQPDTFSAFLDHLPSVPDLVVCAVGDNGDQPRSETDPAFAARVIRVNFEGPVLLLDAVAARMLAAGPGAPRAIVGISSVAGDRGRASNYTYGAAKAGFTAYLSGLRNRLQRDGIHVMTVKPGFVRTKMTAGMALPKALTAEPEEVALAIYRGIQKKNNVIYVRRIWQIVMFIIVHLPEFIFKRMKI